MLWEGRCPTGAPFGLVSSSAQCSSQTAPFSRPFRVTHTSIYSLASVTIFDKNF